MQLFFDPPGTALFAQSRKHLNAKIIRILLPSILRSLTIYITPGNFWPGTDGIYCTLRTFYVKWTQ